MNNYQPRAEKGQALILVVFGIVMLLGFTALAIDGSMVYADRRHFQNAADAASLAGGAVVGIYIEDNAIYYNNWSCSELMSAMEAGVENAAVARAADNGMAIDRDLTDGSGVELSCVGVPGGTWGDRYLEIRTMITAGTDTSFLHFIINGPVRNTVESVTRIRPRMLLGFGNSIVALNENGCDGNENGVIFAGFSQNTLLGGGVFSNGCLRGNGSNFRLDIQEGWLAGNYFYGSITTNSNISPGPQLVSQKIPDEVVQIPAPNCQNLPTRTQQGSTLLPGNYVALNFNNSSNVVLQRGLYCLNGAGKVLQINGGTIRGDGVTIFVTNPSSGISINGGDVDLRAITFYEQANPAAAVPFILIYSLGSTNNADITINGNNASRFQGLIYCPGCTVEVSGTQDTHPTYSTQIIANNVHVSGNAIIDIVYNNQEQYTFPARLDLIK